MICPQHANGQCVIGSDRAFPGRLGLPQVTEHHPAHATLLHDRLRCLRSLTDCRLHLQLVVYGCPSVVEAGLQVRVVPAALWKCPQYSTE
jgi:hypothetical protein